MEIGSPILSWFLLGTVAAAGISVRDDLPPGKSLAPVIGILESPPAILLEETKAAPCQAACPEARHKIRRWKPLLGPNPCTGPIFPSHQFHPLPASPHTPNSVTSCWCCRSTGSPSQHWGWMLTSNSPVPALPPPPVFRTGLMTCSQHFIPSWYEPQDQGHHLLHNYLKIPLPVD